MNKKKSTIISIIFVAAIIVICGALSIKFPSLQNGILTNNDTTTASSVIENNSVHFIDVGQGDSVLVKTDDACILIDAGPKNEGDTVTDYLKEQNIKTLDYLITTHPHADHIGGVDDVLNEFEVKNIIMPAIPESVMPTTEVFENMLDLIDEKDINVIQAVPGSRYDFGEDYFEILGPNKEYYDLNMLSVVTRFSIDGKTFLLTGDAEKESESDMLAEFPDVSADVLKVAHHGSSTSSDENFLRAISPSTAVIMCGEDNSYGHPHDETIEALDKLKIKYYRTDECGNIVMTVENGEITIHKEKS